MKFVVLIGRVLYAAIFLQAVPFHFSQKAIDYAASKGVPGSHLLVPLSGILAGLGALSILSGFRARTGAWLIVIFLVPVTRTFLKKQIRQE